MAYPDREVGGQKEGGLHKNLLGGKVFGGDLIFQLGLALVRSVRSVRSVRKYSILSMVSL